MGNAPAMGRERAVEEMRSVGKEMAKWITTEWPEFFNGRDIRCYHCEATEKGTRDPSKVTHKPDCLVRRAEETFLKEDNMGGVTDWCECLELPKAPLNGSLCSECGKERQM